MAMKKLDKRVGAAFAAAGIAFMILAIRNNPTDTAEKLEIMRHDVKVILANGGVVATESYNSKFGSAYLYTGIDAKSWSPTLADSYANGFLLLGWKKRDFEGEFCFAKEELAPRCPEILSTVRGRLCMGST